MCQFQKRSFRYTANAYMDKTDVISKPVNEIIEVKKGKSKKKPLGIPNHRWTGANDHVTIFKAFLVWSWKRLQDVFTNVTKGRPWTWSIASVAWPHWAPLHSVSMNWLLVCLFVPTFPHPCSDRGWHLLLWKKESSRAAIELPTLLKFSFVCSCHSVVVALFAYFILLYIFTHYT